jgi:hypothetical protein
MINNRQSYIIHRPSSACTLPAVRFVPLELCPFATTFVENPLQIDLFLQNKPKFPRFSPKNNGKAKKQTQFKPNSNPIFGHYQGGKANSNPNKFILDVGLLAFLSETQFHRL